MFFQDGLNDERLKILKFSLEAGKDFINSLYILLVYMFLSSFIPELLIRNS